jgi:serine/threonine protein kinase
VKFQCVLCLSTYNVEKIQFGDSIACPNCGKKIVVPKKNYDRGRVIGGDFVIDRILGTGGMGTVYLARQISLERDVALKVLARKFSIDPKFRMEFQREARAASRLTHSNLVQAYAFGEDESDLFLAMEYVEGVTLGDRLDNETRLVLDEVMNIVQQVAEGLHFAWTHEQLIHRDIKPDNIMLTPDGHVKLTDMGLARTQVELENVTEVSGTPAYMNPEQFTKQPMDCRADIYSLGVCLFHSLTGQLPFDSPNVRELARQHIQDKLEFPDKTIDLSPEIKKLIRTMMAKNREDRYNDHEDLLNHIYETRLKLNQTSTHVPSVHTLSFNRYEFKNLKPRRKEKDTDTQVSSTKQLPRKKIKPLSSVTSTLTSSFTTVEGESRGNNFFINNLVAILAIIAAIIMVYLFGGDTESRYYQDAQKLFTKVPTELSTPDEVLDAVNELLSRKINTALNKKDYYARTKLMEIKVKYLNIQQDLLEEQIKAEAKIFDSYKKNARLATAEQKKQFELLSQDLSDKKRQLALDRKRFKELVGNTGKTGKSQQNTSSFRNAISDDIKLLEFLWKKEQNIFRVEILKKLPSRNFEEALKMLNDIKEKEEYTGVYARWFQQQITFVDDAREVWEFVEENLQVVKNAEIEIKDDEVHLVDKVYPGSGELEYDEGTIIKINDLDTKQFLKLYKQICSIEGTKPVNVAAYAVSTFNFNLAYQANNRDIRVRKYAEVYLSQRLAQVKRLEESTEREKAVDLAQKTIKECNKVKDMPDMISLFNGIFREDVIEPEIED